MKYLLLIAVALVLWWVWKKRTEQPLPKAPPAVKSAENIVACAHCGVLHPVSESHAEEGHQFCSEAHRRAGKSALHP